MSSRTRSSATRGWTLAYVPLQIGSWAPDLMTKWFVYGISIGGLKLKASDPAQFHRGWPGVGFTHSLLFGGVLAFLIWRFSGARYGRSAS